MSTEYKYNATNNHWEHHQTTNDNVVMVVKPTGSSSPTNDDRTIRRTVPQAPIVVRIALIADWGMPPVD
jgi:hypothetical protein